MKRTKTKFASEHFKVLYLVKINDGKRMRRRWIQADNVSEAASIAEWMFPNHIGTIEILKRKEVFTINIEVTKESSNEKAKHILPTHATANISR